MILTRRQTLVTLAAFAAAAALPGLALAQGTPDIPDMTMGADDAPVTLVEYAMFTCPHCAAFHREVFPQIKANFIDTGKVRLVYREVYFNRPSLWAAMIARCAPQDRYFGIAGVLYDTQSQWVVGDEQELIGNLFAIGRQAGMTDDQMNACMQDRAKAEAMVATYQRHAETDGIDATPTFFVNDEKVGNMPYDEFEATLNAALPS